ncbi:TetR/AcrR family transcriptional regulator [Methylosarcina fibrata]|uniref:TetR/AcrR family transcriptional regulator n=1 Tax=Methylosarcina fibrata TaxID=105972 RepID=UPI00036BBEE8|nr:TetR/AcrR family transcriptional regulator [Methylosarcina fibrata]
MARRSEHSLEEIKEMVLNAAESIVIEGGGPALTMRKIAMDIGYTVGSIYMVFDNMSDLILHINARTLDGIAAELEKAPESEAGAWLDQVAKLYLRYATVNFNRWSLIFEHRLPKNAPVPDWYQAKVERVFRKFEVQFARLVPGRSETENKQAARALWGGIHGISMLSLSGKLDIVGVEDVEKSIELLVGNFISGWMRTRPAAS